MSGLLEQELAWDTVDTGDSIESASGSTSTSKSSSQPSASFGSSFGSSSYGSSSYYGAVPSYRVGVRPFVTFAGSLRKPRTAQDILSKMGYLSPNSPVKDDHCFTGHDRKLYKQDHFLPPGMSTSTSLQKIETVVQQGHLAPAKSAHDSLLEAITHMPAVTKARKLRVVFDVSI